MEVKTFVRPGTDAVPQLGPMMLFLANLNTDNFIKTGASALVTDVEYQKQMIRNGRKEVISYTTIRSSIN